MRKRKLPLLAAMLTLAALAVALTISAASNASVGGTTTVEWGGQGVSGGSTCNTTSSDLLTPGPGQKGWLFVLNQISGDPADWRLNVNFGPGTADDQTGLVPTVTTSNTAKWAVYSAAGDTLDAASATGSGGTSTGNLVVSHCFGAAKSKPTIVTDPGEGGKVGVKLNDTATLADGSTSPAIGGTITFKLFPPSDANCAGTPVYTDVVDVNGNDTYGTESQGDNPGGYVSIVHGTYQWTADYSGDDNNEPASSGCGLEAFVTETAASNVLTEVRDTADKDVTNTLVPLGSVVHDHAKVTAPGSPNTPEGTVDFTFYNGTADEPCSGDPVTTENGVALVNGEADSKASDPLGPGTYGYLVKYHSSNTEAWTDGDGTCEPFTVDQGHLTADTILHNAAHDEIANGSHVDLGSVMHDTAQISGQVPGFDAPSADDVTFTFYKTIGCTDTGTSFKNTGLDEVSNDPRSDATDALTPGDYGFTASVPGNKYYEGDTSDCEPFTVDQGTTKSSTEIHLGKSDGEGTPTVVGGGTHVDLGSFVHDSASVTGSSDAFAPTGNVVFTFYTTIDCTPDNGGSAAGTVALDASGVAHPSADEGALAAGSYSFRATYVGDTNYKGSTSDCEPLTVDQARTTTVTKVKDAAGNDVTNKAVLLNSFVHDSATVGPAVPGFPITGTVTYSLFSGDCVTGTKLIPDETVPVGTDSTPYQVIATGAYAYSATYSGDSNYKGSTGVCEPFIVRTFGKTMGFWGNTNGQALLVANDAFSAAKAVTLGLTSPSGLCYIVVDTQAKSKTIFPNTLNGTSILRNCLTTGTRDPGINTASLNTLLGQTLALSYNNLYKSGFAGQTIGAMGCTAVGTLTPTSTTQDAQTYANYLIANAKLGAPVVTQSQIGAMNTLLGCMNAEA
jgi:hypothetical protein